MQVARHGIGQYQPPVIVIYTTQSAIAIHIYDGVTQPAFPGAGTGITAIKRIGHQRIHDTEDIILRSIARHGYDHNAIETEARLGNARSTHREIVRVTTIIVNPPPVFHYIVIPVPYDIAIGIKQQVALPVGYRSGSRGSNAGIRTVGARCIHLADGTGLEIDTRTGEDGIGKYHLVIDIISGRNPDLILVLYIVLPPRRFRESTQDKAKQEAIQYR